MPLVSSKDMLLKAAREGYAVGAFNIENMEIAQAVIEGAVEMNAPVMIQTTSGTLQYAPPEVFYSMVKALADRVSVPIALHLDHGSGLELVQRCRDAGYTSLMIDGSKLPFEDNVDITCKAVTMAGDIPVEAELGTVGGKEDGMEGGIQYTDPAKAAEFVQRTGLSSLAVAIGTAHGVYKGEPRLNIDLLASIHAATPGAAGAARQLGRPGRADRRLHRQRDQQGQLRNGSAHRLYRRRARVVSRQQRL